MTPLAQHIARELLLAPKKRTFRDRCGLFNRMDDIHCFEVSEIVRLAHDLVFLPSGFDDKQLESHVRRISDLSQETCFLPAPKTWIEWRVNGFARGVLLEGEGQWATVRWAFKHEDLSYSLGLVPIMALGARGVPYGFVRGCPEYEALPDDEQLNIIKQVMCIGGILSLINTPRIIGRRQHMPHVGLERRLLSARRAIGKFPLHAWTEIKLEVTRPPEDLSADPSVEAHLTGSRALHFCRAHLRIRNGRVEFVRAHWRGDASLGTKRSRYEVVQ